MNWKIKVRGCSNHVNLLELEAPIAKPSEATSSTPASSQTLNESHHVASGRARIVRDSLLHQERDDQGW